MPSFTDVKILKYRAEDIYKMVMDIESYPKFLPWCEGAKIVKIISKQELNADLLIKFKGFFQKYSSNVRHFYLNDSNSYLIESIATDGPFKKMNSIWKIHEISKNESMVEFSIDFQFNSSILNKMIGSIFENASHKMVKSFELRAKEIF